MIRMKVKTINPATEDLIAEYDNITKEDVNNRVAEAKHAFTEWKKNYHTRAEILHKVADEFSKNKSNLAKIATTVMGKPINQSLSEIDKCVLVMKYYADNGNIFLHDESLNTDARKSSITFEPIGVIGCIMPWNFPYWQVLRFAAPSLMAGNTVILKPASATLQCGIEIEHVFRGISNEVLHDGGIFQTLVGDSSIGEMLIDSPINAVTFTGSDSVGGKVAQRATSQLKKCVLELGGSDPFIVCGDADVDKASNGAAKGRFINTGQSCIATKRFFVVKSIAKEFIEKFMQHTEKLIVGDPLSESTDIGPLVNNSSMNNMDSIVKDGLKKGAELLTGGERMGSKGWFYKPTLLTNVTTKMRISQEEVFGPVASITVVDNEQDAIKLANDSQFGLGGSIWTEDFDKAERLSKLLDVGIVTVNNVVISDPRIPFGGVKNSGFGRELSRYGMIEFVNIKSVRLYDQLVHDHHVE
jgi:acyl-CoA reductase-like NAD-dependent aldehyde dehydrogenase